MAGEGIILLKDIATPAIVTVIATVIIAFFVWLVKDQVRIFFRRVRLMVFNRQFRFKLFFKYRFNVVAAPITSDFFVEIKAKFPQFRFAKIASKPDSVTIKPETLGNKIVIYTSSVRELMADEELIEDLDVTDSELPEYEITIRLDDDLRLGYQDLGILKNYLVIFNEIRDILRHRVFNNQSEVSGFIICDIIREIHPITKKRTIVREAENAQISFINDNIKIKLKNTEYLDTLIKNYIAY